MWSPHSGTHFVRRFELKETHWDSRHARQTSWTQKMARSPRVMNVFNLIYTTFIIIKVYIGTMHYIIDRWLLESYLSIRQSYAINSNGYVGDLEWFKLKIWIKSFDSERLSTSNGFKLKMEKRWKFLRQRNAASDKSATKNEFILCEEKWIWAAHNSVKSKESQKREAAHYKCDWIEVTQWIPLNGINWLNSIGRMLSVESSRSSDWSASVSAVRVTELHGPNGSG